MGYSVHNVPTLIDRFGRDAVSAKLKTFTCRRNTDMERFVRSSAIDFSVQGIAITFGILDDALGELLGIFTLANKVLRVPENGISKTAQRKLRRFSDFESPDDTIMLAAPLIAQLGRNDSVSRSAISGAQLVGLATDVIANCMRSIGGRVVYLECEDIPALVLFYERMGFRIVCQRESKAGTTLNVLMKILHV